MKKDDVWWCKTNDVKQQFFNEKNEINLELVKSLKEQIVILKSEIYFLRKEMKEKNNILKMFFHSSKPSPPGNGFILP